MTDSNDSSETVGEGGPSVEVDYGVFSVEVTGGEGDDVEDVNAVMDERIEAALGDVESLKRTSFELETEYGGDDGFRSTGMTQ